METAPLCGGFVVEDAQAYSRAINEFARGTTTYSIGPGNMNGISRELTVRLVTLGMTELSQVCALSVRRVASSARVRFEFAGHDDNRLRVDKVDGVWRYALAKAYSSGLILINQDRFIANLGERRTLPVLVGHEVGHLAGLNHSPDQSCAMHYTGSAPYWCPSEVVFWQDRHGQPAEVFYPVDRSIAGERLRYWLHRLELDQNNHRKWAKRRDKAAEDEDWQEMLRLNEIVGEALDKLIRTWDRVKVNVKSWEKANRRWANVPKVYRVGK